MKKLLFSLSLSVALLVPFAASAHILAKDGTVSAELHVDPDDDPKVNATSTLEFEFQTGTPDFASCGCHATVMQNGHTLVYKAVGDPGVTVSTTSMMVDYMFPNFGPYTIIMIGGSSTPFTLTYNIDVEDGGSGMSGMQMSFREHGLHLIVFGFGFLAVLYVILKPERADS